jgi:DNA recombination protein RmuC
LLAWALTRAAAKGRESLLEERLAQARADVEELRAECGEWETRCSQREEALAEASQARSTAETRNERIPQLEEELKAERARKTELEELLSKERSRVSSLNTQLEEERKAAEEKLALVNEAQVKLKESFQALASEALKSNNQSFLELARENLGKLQESASGDLKQRQQAIGEMVKPLQDSLKAVTENISRIEKEREGAYHALREQVGSLAQSQIKLQSETSNLVQALRSPVARGRWGEIQLRRVVEMAGMVDHCDFEEQASTQSEGGMLRPDMVIRLPNEKHIIVDSKVSIDAFLNAIDCAEEEKKREFLTNHAKQVRSHINRLSAKNYWQQFDPTPEFVVLFMPGESFFSAALEHDPQLIEIGADKRVIISTPTTLISLLRAVAYGWRQEQLEQNAQRICGLGQELYDRLRVLAEHFEGLRKGLDRANDSYNKAVGALESRVLVTARRFEELGAATDKRIPQSQAIEATPRALQAPEVD